MQNPNIKVLSNGIHVLAADTHISRWTEEHGSLNSDPHLFRWLLPKLKDCKVAWDLGAFIGDHTRQYLDAGMRVYAFEPNPDAFACLKANCPDAKSFIAAASDSYGTMGFWTDANAGASHVAEQGLHTTITVVLDDLLGQRTVLGDSLLLPPDFIKIDIEGFEPKALKGMEQTIRTYKPKLFVEFNKGALERNQSSPEALRSQIESYGYTSFQIYPPNAKPTDAQYDYLIS